MLRDDKVVAGLPAGDMPAVGCAQRSAPAAGAGGLVPFSTSVTQESGGLPNAPLMLIDRVAGRLKRMKSGVMTAARLIFEELEKSGERWQPWMITPTYRPGCEWEPTHITSLVRRMRAWAERRGFKLRYVWVAEIQERRYSRGDAVLGECVHYHLLVWIPKRLTPPKPDKQGWWPWGMTQRLRVNRPLKYILKYASKGGEIVEFPRGLRLHACGGLAPPARNHRTWWLSPRWVRAIWSEQEKPRRRVGGGFISQVTGQWFPSIWRVISRFGDLFVIQRDDLDLVFPLDVLRKLQAAGAVTWTS